MFSKSLHVACCLLCEYVLTLLAVTDIDGKVVDGWCDLLCIVMREMCDVGWMYVGMAGGACFIILQLILLVDFAHNWHSRWSVSKTLCMRLVNVAVSITANTFSGTYRR